VKSLLAPRKTRPSQLRRRKRRTPLQPMKLLRLKQNPRSRSRNQWQLLLPSSKNRKKSKQVLLHNNRSKLNRITIPSLQRPKLLLLLTPRSKTKLNSPTTKTKRRR